MFRVTRERVLFALGAAILIRGTVDHRLTPEELMAGLTLLGLVPLTQLDKRGRNGDESA